MREAGWAIARRAMLLSMPALAQPMGPVTIIVPYSAGSPPDIVGRMVADGLARRTGQPHIVDNRAGASVNIGTQAVARAAPDGRTLLLTTTTLAMNVSLFRSVPYDPQASFAPIAEIATIGFGLLLHPSAGADARAFVAQARAAPGSIAYGSPGIGTPQHLAMELFRQQAGIEVTHVPYRGLSAAVTDLLAGRVGAMFVTIGAARELGGGGRVRLAAVAGPARLPSAPEVPTLREQGLPETPMDVWYGLFAPAGTPAETVARLNALTNEMLAAPETRAAMVAGGMVPAGGPPERLATLLAAELPRWAGVVRNAGITPE